MKIITKILVCLMLVIGVQVHAQGPGDSRPLASNSSYSGRKELKREKKVQKRSYKNAKEQERKAWKKSPNNKNFTLGKKSRKKVKSKKGKEKGDAKPKSDGDAY